jgi:hypothetical protein
MTNPSLKIHAPARSCFLLVLALLAAGAARAQSFTRGDCNDDGNIARGVTCEITDSIFLLNYLFTGGPAPPCREACNVNDDDSLDISDAVHGLLFCFLGGPAPAAPFPGCGGDPTPSLDCGSFQSCLQCPGQDARGVGPCDAIVGIFWDGFRCSYQSGCTCEGEDCGESYDSLEACYDDHSDCPSICDPMDARGEGACEMLLGYVWDGYSCRSLSGCKCEGEDCERLYLDPDECQAAVLGCGTICRPMDARGVGPCAAIIGYSWDGFGCSAIGGCDCEGSDCDAIYMSPGECEIAHGACPPACAPMDVEPVGTCKKILGTYWDGKACQTLVGCSCEGPDCDRLVSSDACALAHRRCPEACAAMDVSGVGACDMVLGYYYDGKACKALSGCECQGADCDKLLESAEECFLLSADCGPPPPP